MDSGASGTPQRDVHAIVRYVVREPDLQVLACGGAAIEHGGHAMGVACAAGQKFDSSQNAKPILGETNGFNWGFLAAAEDFRCAPNAEHLSPASAGLFLWARKPAEVQANGEGGKDRLVTPIRACNPH